MHEVTSATDAGGAGRDGEGGLLVAAYVGYVARIWP